MTITYTDQLLSGQAYRYLRGQVGWSMPDEKVCQQALENLLYQCAAYAHGQLVGCGGVFGDQYLHFSLLDLIVHPAFQNQGIETQLMHKILAFLKQVACPDEDIRGVSAKGQEAFYSQLGFTIRPTDTLGSGMFLPFEALEQYES